MKTISLNEQEQQALSLVVDYLIESEAKHYEESNQADNHIYQYVKTLEKALQNNQCIL